jgi:hypothetical protein
MRCTSGIDPQLMLKTSLESGIFKSNGKNLVVVQYAKT